MRYALLAVVVIVGVLLVEHVNGIVCPKCSRKKCARPKGCAKKYFIKDRCNCCNVCPTKNGKPCSGLTPKCEKNLWCIKRQKNCAEARKNLFFGDTFQGVCGRILIP